MSDPHLNGAAKPDEGVPCLVLAAGQWLIGLVSTEEIAAWIQGLPIMVHCPYAFGGGVQVKRSVTEREAVDIGVAYMVQPLLGLASLRALPVLASTVLPLSKLHDREQRAIMAELQKCEAIAQEIRRVQAGIAKPRIVLPGS